MPTWALGTLLFSAHVFPTRSPESGAMSAICYGSQFPYCRSAMRCKSSFLLRRACSWAFSDGRGSLMVGTLLSLMELSHLLFGQTWSRPAPATACGCQLHRSATRCTLDLYPFFQAFWLARAALCSFEMAFWSRPIHFL